MAKGITIYDVANEAGVSAATVSRVMNEPSKVALKKRTAVLDAIKKFNFVPKADAVINARRAYKKIGVIAPLFTQPSFMERLRGISGVLSAEHYELVIYSIDTVKDLENYINSLVVANRIDGLIFLCIHLESASMHLLRRAKFPVVFVEEKVEGFDSVIVRNLEGGQQAGEYFWELGCRDPGFIGERADKTYAVEAMEDRLRGYKFVFANHGIVPRSENFWIGQYPTTNIDDGIEAVLSQPQIPDCIFCSSDVIAARLINIAREKGIKIPEQLKVLGFDNIDISPYIGLSSVDQKLDESGRLAAELLLSKIQAGGKVNCGNKYLDLEIIERHSSSLFEDPQTEK